MAIQGASVWLADPGIHGYEELYNAAHAWLIAKNGPELIFPLQYRVFCGGCSVVALMGAGVFSILGPSILAWRLVGLSFFLLALSASAELARRVGGTAAAVAVAALFACAPPAYQELAQISHGNHPEGGALLVLQLLLAALAFSSPPGWRREALGFLLAVLVGMGIFFLRSLVLGVVPLVLVMATGIRTPRFHVGRLLIRGPIMGLGLALGLSPMLAVRRAMGAWPLGFMYLEDEWSPSLEWTVHNLQSLFHPAQLRGIWGDVAWREGAWLGLPAFGAWVLLISMLVVWLGLSGRIPRRQREDATSTPKLWLAGSSVCVLCSFLTLYSVYRLSVSIDLVNFPTPWQVRYVAVVYPTMLVVAAMGFGVGWSRLRLPLQRGALVTLLLALALPGGAARWRIWSQGDPWLAIRRRAPDWCYQPECVQGSVATMKLASNGNPLHQLALAGGLHQATTSIALAAESDLPTSCTDLDLQAEPRQAEAWAWGAALGAIVPARDLAQGPGTFPLFMETLVQGLPAAACSPTDDSLREQLWRASWCHARPQLQDAGGNPSAHHLTQAEHDGDDRENLEHELFAELGSLGAGVQAARACYQEPSTAGSAARLRWDPNCPAWRVGADYDALGWGLGTALAEAKAGRLLNLEIALSPLATDEELASMKQGFDRGWRWGSRWHWIPDRLPELDLEWHRTTE